MVATKLDGTAIAKTIRERLGAEILEKQKLNPRYKPSLKILQGTIHLVQTPRGIRRSLTAPVLQLVIAQTHVRQPPPPSLCPAIIFPIVGFWVVSLTAPRSYLCAHEAQGRPRGKNRPQ